MKIVSSPFFSVCYSIYQYFEYTSVYIFTILQFLVISICDFVISIKLLSFHLSILSSVTLVLYVKLILFQLGAKATFLYYLI